MLVTLGWMLLTGLPVPTQSPIAVSTRSAEPRAVRPAAGRVTVWTDRDEPYRRGEGARVYLSAQDAAHVAVFRVDTDGRIRVLFPQAPWGENFVPAGRTLEVSGARGGRSFMVDDYPGVGYLFAVASPRPFEFGDIARGDYWDFRLIEGGRLRGDPYVLLVNLAERITRGGDYDYDIAPYYVDRRYDYPRFVCYDCHAYASYDEWDPYERACSRYRIVVYDDPAAYPYRYGQGRRVVTATRPGPRYLFRDADPRHEYVTRLPGGAAAESREPAEHGRTSRDIGGRGSVPAPGLQSLNRTGIAPVEPEVQAGRARVKASQRPEAERGRDTERARVPEGLRQPGEDRRAAPADRATRRPRSTGEPELRRRRP